MDVNLAALRLVSILRWVAEFVPPRCPRGFFFPLYCLSPLPSSLVGPCFALFILAGKSLIALLLFVVSVEALKCGG